MTPETRHIVDLALAKYRDHLLFALDMTGFAKGHTLRKQTAKLLWETRKAQIELGMYIPTYSQMYWHRPRRVVDE